MSERILGPALRTTAGAVHWLREPSRHHDVIKLMASAGLPREEVANSDQSFWTSDDQYVSREDAWNIADRAEQIKQPERARRHRELFTECMW